MKKSSYILGVLLTFILLISMVHSCGTPVPVLRRTYRPILETSASQMTDALLEMISPQSGRNPNAVVDFEDIYFNEKENLVGANVLLTWEARDILSGVSYGECKVTGTLYVSMPLRGMDNTTAVLKNIRYNDHLSRVSTSKNLKILRDGIRITVR